MKCVDGLRLRAFGKPLEVGLDLLERTLVDQLAQLLLPEQLAQQLAVERQRRRAPLGVRLVALVHVGGDVVEQQRRRERRRGLRLHLDHAQLARVELAQQVGQAREVEHVAQALAVGLEHDRELRVALGDLEQGLRLQPLLPEGGAPPRIGARDQQRPAGVLAEARAEQSRPAQLADHAVLELVRVDQDELRAGRLVGVGEVDDDPVVRPDGVGLEPVLVADASAQRQAPRRVDAPAVRTEDAQAPVADLVPEALDDDGALARDDAGRLLLLAQELDQVRSSARVEVVVALQGRRVLLDRPARERADRLAELARAADAVALPERHRARHTRRRRHDHAVAGDLLDPPRRRAEQEHLAGPRLVDHLLVELADPAPVREVHAEQPAVGDRARVGDRERARALAVADRARHAIPHDPRAQLAELLRRVAPVEHVEHVLELRARQLRVGVGPEHQCVEVIDRERLGRGGHGDDLLGEHVERVARHDGRLDRALAHALGDDRALEQVGAELREDAPLRRLADVVARAADPLEAGGDRLRRLDLQHEVDRAHVDAELERRRRHQARQLAGLQLVLDHEPLLACQRAVVRPRDLLLRELVEPQRQPLRPAAVVDEHDRRAVLAHQLQDLRVDRGPDRLAGRFAAPERARERVEVGRRRALVGLDHALHRYVDLEVQRLAHAGVDHRARPLRTDQEAPDLLQRVLGGAQPDPLHVALRHLGEPLQRHREVRAALGLRDRVDLVDDHPLGALEELARLAGEHQVERLGRGDQHVGRVLDHVPPLLLRRVAGADRDGDVAADPSQWRAQVLLDVVRERLQRRDVHEPGALLLTRRRRLGHEAVECPQEGGECLAGAGGRRDQRVLAGRDRRPRLGLCRRRLREGPREPVSNLGRERG